MKSIENAWKTLADDLEVALAKLQNGAKVEDVMQIAGEAYSRLREKLPKSFGQIAYEGYFDSCGGKSLISGAPLPMWDAQSGEIKIAWDRAAIAVISAYEREGVR